MPIERVKRPAFQFYPGDWLEDMGLRACSLAARGLWVDILCFMHQGEPYGHLRRNGRDVEPEALARMVGASRGNVVRLLAELEDRHVFSRTEGGTIHSRRMVRDEHNREVRAEGGVKGGAAAFRNPRASRPGDKREGGRPGGSEGGSDGGSAVTPPSSPSPSPSPTSNERTNGTGDGAPATPTKAIVAIPKPTAPDWNGEFAEDFREVYGGPASSQLFVHVKAVARKYGWERTRPALRALMAETPLEFLNIPKLLAVRIEAGDRPPPMTHAAKQRLVGMNAMLRGGLKGAGRDLERGDDGPAGELPGQGSAGGGAGEAGRELPARTGRAQ